MSNETVSLLASVEAERASDAREDLPGRQTGEFAPELEIGARVEQELRGAHFPVLRLHLVTLAAGFVQSQPQHRNPDALRERRLTTDGPHQITRRVARMPGRLTQQGLRHPGRHRNARTGELTTRMKG
jgi:hypothetical protein